MKKNKTGGVPLTDKQVARVTGGMRPIANSYACPQCGRAGSKPSDVYTAVGDDSLKGKCIDCGFTADIDAFK